ncbi:ABC-type multidrug transport system fused ATPase/permease subunit [Friedmanniella endophytica]|uniref:ABC-type multidrug transport system fused ATPase/permease subunit n=1 Tax=Microlunatus kandeliicorticis TaxID=1759536 RepID=A0A7W3IRF7_9ACTN|nr:ABC transporter ATP-binding protein [Microlunatus kandeliicorticis]MBA8793862.1 ABC-type multidrug transport system fused ATPase/permease subunit [Microlunatus kandeliicorticis]
MTELAGQVAERGLPGSSSSWRAYVDADGRSSEPPRIPAELIIHRDRPVGDRLRAWQVRHLLRARRAQETYTSSRHPERGLPVAGWQQMITFVGGLLRNHRLMVIALLVGNGLAAVAGLVVPRILGALVDKASGTGTLAGELTGLALAVAAVVLVQAVLTFGAGMAANLLGQNLLAQAREYVVGTVLNLPLSRVEQASSGDLVTRVTRDVSTMSDSIRSGLPQAVVALVTTVLAVVAMVINSPLLALPLLLSVPGLWISVSRYLKRAPMGYITEGAAYSTINTSLTESVEGARTVEAFGLEGRRRALTDDDLDEAGQAERYTMALRNFLFCVMDLCYNAPLVWTLLLGGLGYANGWVTLGQITAATLYIQFIVEPLDRLISNVDRLQVGVASTTRLLGIATVPPDREVGTERPHGDHLVGRDLRFAYRADHDVLHGVDLDLRSGERLAIVGPSGSGKSTLGRLLAGINGPRTGSVTVGDVELTRLPLDLLRTQVALVTQEHHVFVGSIRDNIVLAREDSGDDVVINALRTVDAWSWVQALPDGLDTKVGSGQVKLTPAQAQQIALARLVVADPHTLVLDEATSLIDPRTARHLEGSMAALLEDRTVVAIAHRLHTAHDADRIAVMVDGRIAELGSHDELLAADGEYAALWRAWSS